MCVDKSLVWVIRIEMQGRASTSSRSAVSLGVGLYVTGTIKRRSECSKEGAIGRRRARESCEGSSSETCCGRVRAMADSWGQSQLEAIGSSSPQTSANTDVRHVTCAESSSAERQDLKSMMKGSGRSRQQGRIVRCDAINADRPCRRRRVM